MNQGDIVLVRLDPTEGQEQRGVRPAVILSGDAINQSLDIRIVCPLTKKFKGLPGIVTLIPDGKNNLTAPSNVMTFQIRTVTTARIIKKIGSVNAETVEVIRTEVVNVLTF